MKTAALLVAGCASLCSAADRMPRIDAHAHVFQAAPVYFQMLERLDLRVLNICVVDKHDRGFEDAEPQHKLAMKVYRESHGRAAWCSTFDPNGFEKPGFAAGSIAQLDETFKNGAVAVKIYKDIGMELKTAAGKYVMPDDPAFAGILDVIGQRGRTLFAHIAEPSAAWRPLDPSSPHYSYYKSNPDWHMYLHPERPSKEAILDARDRMLAAHPGLRIVGCHLGSMEEDVDEIAKRLDKYPNFAVDTAARIPDLLRQPREKVRAFLIKYQDRVLYATDLVMMPWDDARAGVKHMESEYERDWKYFTGDLALPDAVLRKLYRENAERWVPGLAARKIGN